MVDEVKRKYKDKIADLKKQIADLTEANDSLNSEVGNWKYQLEDSKNNHERIVAQLQNDMKVIKNEWDKKCQEIDLSSQRTIVFFISQELTLG
jgi:predicted  nucleic acid-binding Zn-ribbon protein